MTGPKTLISILAIGLLCATIAAASEPPALPFVVTACVRTDVAPAIDGKLDDACWRRTRPMEPFVKLTLGTLANFGSIGYMAYDSENLYIGVHCQEPAVDKIRAEVTRRDGAVFGDDCIEIFLIPPDSTLLAGVPEHARYFHLVANSVGTIYDEIGLEAPTSYDGQWRAAGAKGPDYWELEVAIPFSELGTSARDGAAWTGNISRARWLEKEYTSWSPIQRTFHDKDRFGRIVFTTDLAQTEEQIAAVEFAAVKSALLQVSRRPLRRRRSSRPASRRAPDRMPCAPRAGSAGVWGMCGTGWGR